MTEGWRRFRNRTAPRRGHPDEPIRHFEPQAAGECPAARSSADEPPVDLLLDVDREYREKAKSGELRLIAPKKFNPEGKAWLPILHTERGPWHFTALFSNTPRAHDLKKTDDWVVIFCSAGHHAESQCTVVTETAGPQRGKRVVRGRERECTTIDRQDPTRVLSNG